MRFSPMFRFRRGWLLLLAPALLIPLAVPVATTAPEPPVAAAAARALDLGPGFDAHSPDLIERTLREKPRDPRGLALAGIQAFRQGDYDRAAWYWRRLARALPSDAAPAVAAAARAAQRRAHERAFGFADQP